MPGAVIDGKPCCLLILDLFCKWQQENFIFTTNLLVGAYETWNRWTCYFVFV